MYLKNGFNSLMKMSWLVSNWCITLLKEIYFDRNYAELPEGTQITSISPHGASYWTRTAEVQTKQADGSPQSFFLKVSYFTHNQIFR